MLEDKGAFYYRNASFLIFFLTIAIRISAIFILGWNTKPDTWEYHDIALNILDGKGYLYKHDGNTEYLFYLSPFYSYWSAFIYFLTNKNYLILEIIQTIVAGSSVLFLMKIARNIFSERVAFASGLFYSLHPGLIVYTIKLHEFIFVAWLILILVYLILMRRNLFVIGILIGLGCYIRVIFIFFIPAFFIYHVMRYKFRTSLYRTLILIILASIVITPWIHRGYKAYNRFIFFRTDAAQAFWQANNPFASGSGLTKDNKPIFYAMPEEFQQKVKPLNEIERYDFFRKEAMNYIRQNPIHFVKNTVKKFYYFWWFSPQAGLSYPLTWLVIYKVCYCFIILFFILGVSFIFKNRTQIDLAAIIFLVFFILLISILHSVGYVELRHRWLIEPLLMIISSYGVVGLFFRGHLRDWSS